MDGNRFDEITKTLVSGTTRRRLLAGLAGGVLGAFGLREAGAQVSQAQCGNVICKNNPGVCNPGCVCCVYGNGNSRCRPPGLCSGGTETCPADRPFVDPARGCVRCLTASQCPVPTGACETATCTNGVCGIGPAQAGTVCRPAIGPCDVAESCTGSSTTCPPDAKLANTTPCDADGDACTVGDACQAGVCVPGLPRECRPCQTCSGGDCVPVATDTRCPAGCCAGICCRDDETCVNGICQAICFAAGTACTTSLQCCEGTICNGIETQVCDQPFGNYCTRGPLEACASDCECGVFFPKVAPYVGTACENGRCCLPVGRLCDSALDCCQSGPEVVCQPSNTPGTGGGPDDPICCIPDGGPCSDPLHFCCNGDCVNGQCGG